MEFNGDLNGLKSGDLMVIFRGILPTTMGIFNRFLMVI